MKKMIFLFAMLLTAGVASADRKYATFVAPTGSGGSYDAESSTYTWTKNSDNLMTVFTFSSGELATYHTLKITRIGGTYAGTWRANVLFSDGKNKSFSWYNYNDKSIDLSAGTWGGQNLTTDEGKAEETTHTLADVTAIRIGGASDPGEGNAYSVVLDWTCVYLDQLHRHRHYGHHDSEQCQCCQRWRDVQPARPAHQRRPQGAGHQEWT